MNIKIVSSILFFLVLSFSFLNPVCIEAETRKLMSSDYILLGPNSYYLFTETDTPIEEILKPEMSKNFIKNNTDYPNFGIESKELWIKVELDLSQSLNPIIEAATPLVKKIRFYQYCEGKEISYYQSGMDFSDEKLPQHPNYQFPIQHSLGSVKYF